jgi:hypothetical protein
VYCAQLLTGRVGGGSLPAYQRDFVRELAPRDRVVVLDKLALLDERLGQVRVVPRVAERRLEALVREHDHEHVLDRRRVARR